MKRILSFLVAITLSVSVLFTAGCSQEEDVIVLDVYNWEDYICRDDEADLIADFENYYYQTYGKKVKVNYSTFGTNENMYNELQLSKTQTENGYDYGYDLVCPSDYMIQKMIYEGMLEKFDYSINEGEEGNLSDYRNNVSDYIYKLFSDQTDVAGNKVNWNDYAAAYMYGTMGFVYNPDVLAANGYATGDESHWELPWKTYSKNLGTIKDSIRDTYALAIGKVYSEELTALANEYANDIENPEYQRRLVEIFNRTDDRTVEMVTKELIELKGNVYGFEVDSGKRDMASGKIAINFAWSGDAVYTLDIAEEDGTILYYAVPEEGSNIWFDGWVMPKGSNTVVSQEFINFLSKTDNAIKNMNFIGYTPAVSGEDMFYNCIDWYGTFVLIEVPNETEDSVLLDGKYYEEYYIGDAFEEGLIERTDNDIYAELIYPEYDDDYNVIGYTVEEDVQLYDYDVSFLLRTSNDVVNDVNYSVWTDTLGRQLSTQYPDKETVLRCAIMKQFTDVEMKKLNDMWDEVKVSAIPAWLMWMIIIVIVVAAVGIPVYVHLNKKGVRIILKKKNKDLKLVKREIIK